MKQNRKRLNGGNGRNTAKSNLEKSKSYIRHYNQIYSLFEKRKLLQKLNFKYCY